VSSSQNKDNLATQLSRLTNYAAAKGYPISRSVSEVGSGLNDNRPKLASLFADDSWTVLIVEHKDRLTRFGFRYLEWLASSQDRRIEVINAAEDNDDLMEDLVSVITSFCARIYGRRRSRRRTEQIIEELSHDD
jgi:predicted site-specific integrase-resolvase